MDSVLETYPMRERDRDRQTERQTDRQRQRQRENCYAVLTTESFRIQT